MITLYTFGPAFGMSDPSPFVIKADILLKMAGVTYQTNTKGFSAAPKGKLPYLRDDAELVSDSTFIRCHIEKKYGVDFDRGYSDQQRALSYAVEKMLEDQLYWANVHFRWLKDDNFAKGPAIFFRSVPSLIRPAICSMVRRKVRRNLVGHGFGQLTDAEIILKASKSIDATAAILGDKPFLLGDQPCGADAFVYAGIAGSACPLFESGLRNAVERHPNLLAYITRMQQRYYPEQAPLLQAA
jgi:glutathione S-transferase